MLIWRSRPDVLAQNIEGMNMTRVSLLNEKSVPRVVCGFCGVGKSTLLKTYPDKYIDLDSALFPKTDPQRFVSYVDEIKRLLASTDKTVLVSTHPELLERLYECGIDIILVYPNPDLKDEYMARYKDRGDWSAFLLQLEENWTNYMEDLQNASFTSDSQVKVLEEGQHLIDVLKP